MRKSRVGTKITKIQRRRKDRSYDKSRGNATFMIEHMNPTCIFRKIEFMASLKSYNVRIMNASVEGSAMETTAIYQVFHLKFQKLSNYNDVKSVSPTPVLLRPA